KKNLAVADGFVWRHSNSHRESYARLHAGGIGEVRSIYSTYNTGQTTKHDKWNRENCKTDLEWTLRRWYFFTWLSGDHIVEQAIHSVDKMLWTMNDAPPLKCIAHGGRQARTGAEDGHIFDHFAVVYDWEGGVKGFHFCRQQNGCVSGTTDAVFGAKGTYDGVSSRGLHAMRTGGAKFV
ncbi:MAG: gfo/Idh/MocA family oxidoreductase, partial [Verrucomicrobia bacterium]|nr:gfo/Idh/MocA family oxidoreductase [Verrucomicrobiota bacterium]